MSSRDPSDGASYSRSVLIDAAVTSSPVESARIVVIISSNAEWRITKAHLRPARIDESPYGELFTHVITDEPVLFLHGGWGKIAAAASAEYAIGRWQPSILINLGTCGGIEERVRHGEKLLVTRTIVYDIHEAIGDSSEAIDAYSNDIDLSWLDEGFPIHVRRSLLVSGDLDLVPSLVPELIRQYSAVAADWESGAIAHVARRRHTRLLILRSVSDLVSAQHAEAMGNQAFFETQAALSMQALLDDLNELVPYVSTRIR